LIGILQW